MRELGRIVTLLLVIFHAAFLTAFDGEQPSQAPERCDLEQAARRYAQRFTCLVGMVEDDVDFRDCAVTAPIMEILPFAQLQPRRWKNAATYLYRRRGKLGWVAVDRDECRGLAHTNFLDSGSFKPDDLYYTFFQASIISSYPRYRDHDPPLVTADDALWWVQEALRIHFCEMVQRTGRKMGLQFIDEELLAGLAPKYRNDEGRGATLRVFPKSIQLLPRVEKTDQGWTVTLHEWRCQERALFEWVVPITARGDLESKGFRISRAGLAPGCSSAE